VAYRTDSAEGTEVFHNDIRGRFERGEPEVVDAMKFWANVADEIKVCLAERDWDRFGRLLNQNFDKRSEIYRISDENLRMIEVARSTGASAKFTGSGGAIVGAYPDEKCYQRLEEKLGALDVRVIKPSILPQTEPNRP
jgi:glucuronokinase